MKSKDEFSPVTSNVSESRELAKNKSERRLLLELRRKRKRQRNKKKKLGRRSKS